MKGKSKIVWPGGRAGREYFLGLLFVEGVLKGTILDPNTWKAGSGAEGAVVASYFQTSTVLTHHLNKTKSLVRDGDLIKVNDLLWFKTAGRIANPPNVRDWKAAILSGKHKAGTEIGAYKLEKI